MKTGPPQKIEHITIRLAPFAFSAISNRVHTSSTDHEKFAIIGLGCRMPPSASTLEAFWKFLLRGGNAMKPVRKDRWDWRQFFDEDPKRPGKTYAPKFGMLEADVKLFDPLAFGISPREAACMDPQQRLLLEVAWEAFEDAGIPLERMSGSNTGVFIGGFCLDHFVLQSRPSNRHLINAHSPAGATMTVLSNRISHVYNLKGPSFTLDTACSSSLVAIHCACRSLRAGDCETALAGGVNVMTQPDFPILMSKGHFLSDHGECHAFDETAAGYARGEGAGILIIKPLRNALEAGDRIHAVIRGTGVNQDGHTDGISFPNTEAQEVLIRQVCERSGVRPSEVDFVEAHGTGTQAGDPAEARALHVNFSQGREPEKKLLVGSVKTNIGHLEAAAGMAGMLKAVGVLKFREVPRNLHFQHPNPTIPFHQYCLKVAGENTGLPAESEKPVLFAGVNAFGYGGTNAHILLESAPTGARTEPENAKSGPFLIPFSARAEKSLRDLAGKCAFQIGQGLDGTLADLAYTTAFRRSHLSCRCAAVVENLEELREQLMDASTGQPHEGIVFGTKPVESSPPLVFVYTGMGPQWWGMGRELIAREPVFSAALEEIDGHFKALAGWSLLEAMTAPEKDSRMEHTDLSQPANFALQVALTRLWESRGIRPAAVVGHSVGEVASSFVAGVYSMDEALRISFHRSRLQQTMAGKGAMLAVGLPEAEALKWIADSPGVSIAAMNSFSAVTLSGDADQLRSIAAELEKLEIFQKFLRVEVAYHSPQMDPLQGELMECLAGLSPREENIPLYSTAFGRRIPSSDWTANYWWRNVRQPVHFAQAMSSLFEDGYTHFLEVGPHPVLGNSIRECAPDRRIACFTSLRRKEPEQRRLLLTLAELYNAGIDPDWKSLAPESGRFLSLPKYSWQRQEYWLESDRSKMDRFGLPGPVYLNRTLPGPHPCWEVEINRNYFPFLFDHGVQNQTVFAGMGYIEAAITLNQRIHEKPAVVLENVSFELVLIVDYAKLQYLVTGFEEEAGRFVVSSRVEGEEEGLIRHCRGRMLPQTNPTAEKLDIVALKSECPNRVPIEAFYQDLGARGLHYGPAFRPTNEVCVGTDCFLVTIDASHLDDGTLHPLHPAIFDAAIQPVLFCAGGTRLFVPFSIERFEYFSKPDAAACHAFGRLISKSDSMIVADVWLTNAAGEVHAHAHRMSCRTIETGAEASAPRLLYSPGWNEVPIEELVGPDGADVIIFADAEDSDIFLARDLAVLLPGSALIVQDSAQGQDPEKDAVARLLSSGDHAHRNRIISLHGTNVQTSEPATGRLSWKIIELLQAVGTLRPQGADVTFVTRAARPVPGDADLSNLPALPLGALGLVAQNEFESLLCRSIDLPEEKIDNEASILVSELAARSRGDIARRQGLRLERTVAPHREENVAARAATTSVEEPVELRLGAKRKLDSLYYEAAERKLPELGEIELRVHSVSLNYKDVLKIEGHIHPISLEDTFWGIDPGMECAGIVIRCGPDSRFAPGDRIVTILPRAFRSYATIPETFAVKIPDGLGMEASAIPVVYVTAYRGLIDIANLRRGERILIHHGTGGLGLAAINIAQWIGAEIIATAGSDEKKRFLRDLGIRHVFSSRDLDFAQEVRKATGQQGVDVVIGALAGQAAHAGLGLLRAGGRYIEVGKKDIAEDHDLPLRAFNRNLIYASVDIDRLALECPAVIQEALHKVMDHFARGDFKLAATRVFPARAVTEAFHEMARSRHIGKLLVDFSCGDIEVREAPDTAPIVKQDGCYIVTGGTSGFGLVTARWLAEQGAGKVVLASRSGGNAPGIRETVQFIESLGTQIEVLSVDVTDPVQVRAMIECNGAFPLRGVIHGAMVLDDAMMADLSHDRFQRVFLPKVAGALNLAEAIRKVPDLDFLVFYSSISALVGNPGQTNYVAANSFLDGFAHHLRAVGIPAISINWGALAESGVVARNDRLVSALASAGITGLGNTEALGELGKILRMAKPQMGAFHVDWEKWHDANLKLADDPRFRELRIASQANDGSDTASQIRTALAGSSRDQRLRAIEEHLQEILAETLKMSRESVSTTRKLNELGVDSLMVLELGLGIKERIGVGFSAMELLKGQNLQQLAALAENRLWGGRQTS